jgi:DNA polymerase III epsilon subunit-like protein
MKILVFDTESTDKLPLAKGGFYFLQPEFDINVLGTDYLSNPDSVESKTIKRWPTILQLSYIVYDTENPWEVKIFDKYINVASDIWIHPEAEAKHHINAAKIQSSPPEKRTDIKDGINEIVTDMRSVDVVICHNVKFDKNILIGELLKLNLPEMKDDLRFLLDNSHFYCTMDETKRICNLQMAVNYTDKKTGAQKVMYRIKSPKLSEAYEHFFGYAPTGELLHDALVDVIVCLRVYLHLWTFKTPIFI